MRTLRRFLPLLLPAALTAAEPSLPAGDVIFLHPDGASISAWMGLRFLDAGPEGRINWDRLPHVAVYDGRMTDALTSSSNGGATVHAYGTRVPVVSYGRAGADAAVIALSGAPLSLAKEALAAGKWVGVVNSASVTEPGTGAFLASVASRDDDPGIALQIRQSGAQVILGGGETWFLPKEATGRHGPGSREDKRDLVAELRAEGYTVVFTRDELKALPATATKVLGLFAHDDTFNEYAEEQLQRRGLPFFQPQAPTSGEMVAAALAILARAPQGYLLVMNEEGSDNFAGENNAAGLFESLRRADAAIGAALAQVGRKPSTLVLLTSDSAAGGLQVLGDSTDELDPAADLPAVEENGAPVDGSEGPRSRPFLAAPDRHGKRLPFYAAWAAGNDGSGNVVARAAGLNAGRLQGSVDNVEMYRLMYLTLFGRELPR
jgi:alkaline phosphatase